MVLENADRVVVDIAKLRGYCLRTAWIVRRGEDFPRLTSCYVL